MPVKQLKDFLDEHQVQYVSIQHSPSFTSREIAESTHIDTNALAKTVVINMDGTLAMLVLPCSYRVRWDRLQDEMATDFISMAEEEEFKDRFPDCEIGALPPFGNLYDMPVYCYEALEQADRMAFSAGTHSEIIQMDYADYIHLVNPVILSKGFIRKGSKRPKWLRRKKTSSVAKLAWSL
ncbi:MAG: YbaK/EbsC family protein [Hahellaceae bacterium]|nr:YbaK/EbsC family protein [Hahellaceae bacterium]MCP5170534.1 YbaK/EbsC family protein [Hahellaceae bacterium]